MGPRQTPGLDAGVDWSCRPGSFAEVQLHTSEESLQEAESVEDSIRADDSKIAILAKLL